eukprot:2495799-Rhodomonas_salina.1
MQCRVRGRAGHVAELPEHVVHETNARNQDAVGQAGPGMWLFCIPERFRGQNVLKRFQHGFSGVAVSHMASAEQPQVTWLQRSSLKSYGFSGVALS